MVRILLLLLRLLLHVRQCPRLRASGGHTPTGGKRRRAAQRRARALRLPRFRGTRFVPMLLGVFLFHPIGGVFHLRIRLQEQVQRLQFLFFPIFSFSFSILSCCGAPISRLGSGLWQPEVGPIISWVINPIPHFACGKDRIILLG